MIDHVSLKVRDLAASKKFYAAALAPLGYVVMMEYPGAIGLGADGKPDFWLSVTATPTPTHLAFAAKGRDVVNAFHDAALAAGGKDNGKSGLRPEYHPNYYGAFILDPDGHNIEAVTHTPG
ncbi:MAG: VOC family protein [Deltaproteobacteria bacterium]|nr:VOC family protein [Deltaproteobacteria bacterium]